MPFFLPGKGVIFDFLSVDDRYREWALYGVFKLKKRLCYWYCGMLKILKGLVKIIHYVSLMKTILHVCMV